MERQLQDFNMEIILEKTTTTARTGPRLQKLPLLNYSIFIELAFETVWNKQVLQSLKESVPNDQ